MSTEAAIAGAGAGAAVGSFAGPVGTGVGAVVGGVWGALQKKPKRDMSSMDDALAMIQAQYGAINKYYEDAGKDLETQFGALKGRTITDAINQLANTGVYSSPVSEYQLNRERVGLEETYATAKSQLAGQRSAALSGIDAQRVGYYQNLSDMQYRNSIEKYKSNIENTGAVAGLAGTMYTKMKTKAPVTT